MKDDVLHAFECECQKCLDEWEKLEKIYEQLMPSTEKLQKTTLFDASKIACEV